MSTVIWFLTSLTLASSGLCLLPAPVNLNISSRNFVHSLTWEPGPGSPARLRYSVMVYSLRNVAWQMVCELTYDLLCDLTGALPDPGDSYFARVWANRGNQSSNSTTREAFIPNEHTYLDPPVVSVSICGNSLCVALGPPSNQLLSVYGSLRYTLTINNGEDGGQYTLPTYGLVGEKIKDLEPGRKYCVTATIVGRKSGSSRPQCVQSAAVYSADEGISVGVSVLVVVAVAVILFLFYTGFICLQTTTPDTLVSVKPQCVFLLPPSYDVVPYSLVHKDATSPPVAGGSKRENRRNSISEEDSDGGAESGGSGGGGYEWRLPQANESLPSSGSSPKDLPQTDGHFVPDKHTDHCPVSPCVTDSESLSVSGSGTDSGSRSLSLTGTQPPSVSVADNEPLPVSVDRNEPLHPPPLSVTTIGPLPPSVTTIGPLPLSVTTIGPLPLSVTTIGPPPLFVDNSGPFTVLGKGNLQDATSPKTGPCEEEEEEEEEESSREQVGVVKAEGDGGGLNVNLLSVMLVGQGEKEGEEEKKEEEEEKKERQRADCVDPGPLLLGASQEPSVPLLSPPRLKRSWSPPHTQLCTVYTEEEEEEEEEESEDSEEEGCSGYMSRAN